VQFCRSSVAADEVKVGGLVDWPGQQSCITLELKEVRAKRAGHTGKMSGGICAGKLRTNIVA